MHISQATMSVLHLLQGPRLQGHRPGSSRITQSKAGPSLVAHAWWAKAIMTGFSLQRSSLPGQALQLDCFNLLMRPDQRRETEGKVLGGFTWNNIYLDGIRQMSSSFRSSSWRRVHTDQRGVMELIDLSFTQMRFLGDGVDGANLLVLQNILQEAL